MSEFPFDGLDIEPSVAQAKLIARVRELVADGRFPTPDVIQPRPTNQQAIEVFWTEAKLCVVIEPGDQLESIFGRPPAEAA